MELSLQGRNLEVDNATREYIIRKLERISGHVTARTAAVLLNHESTRGADQRYSAEITLDINGSLLRTEECAATPVAAIDVAADVMDRRVEQFKWRLTSGERSKHSSSPSIRYPIQETPTLEIDEEAPEELRGKLVRLKRFEMKPMSADEAIVQMEMLGHAFFMFLNADDHTYNLLYRRADGDYGMIAPDIL